MQDQLRYWDDAHANRKLHAHSLSQTSFAEAVNATIPPGSSILELGCGEGNDSLFFVEQGHTVEATDFSEVAIANNSSQLAHAGLHFSVQDISQSLHYDDNSFDVVYARLSLHYFTDAITRKIFAEIKRVLKPGGYLCFMCKSVEDTLYGQGLRIEADMFELDGHVRHFFSERYTEDLLTGTGFRILSIEKGKDKLYTRQSAYIQGIAQK